MRLEPLFRYIRKIVVLEPHTGTTIPAKPKNNGSRTPAGTAMLTSSKYNNPGPNYRLQSSSILLNEVPGLRNLGFTKTNS